MKSHKSDWLPFPSMEFQPIDRSLKLDPLPADLAGDLVHLFATLMYFPPFNQYQAAALEFQVSSEYRLCYNPTPTLQTSLQGISLLRNSITIIRNGWTVATVSLPDFAFGLWCIFNLRDALVDFRRWVDARTFTPLQVPV
jgi:hypothetical protein